MCVPAPPQQPRPAFDWANAVHSVRTIGDHPLPRLDVANETVLEGMHEVGAWLADKAIVATWRPISKEHGENCARTTYTGLSGMRACLRVCMRTACMHSRDDLIKVVARDVSLNICGMGRLGIVPAHTCTCYHMLVCMCASIMTVMMGGTIQGVVVRRHTSTSWRRRRIKAHAALTTLPGGPVGNNAAF